MFFITPPSSPVKTPDAPKKKPPTEKFPDSFEQFHFGMTKFFKAKRSEVESANPTLKASEVNHVLAGMWMELTEKERNEWKKGWKK